MQFIDYSFPDPASNIAFDEALLDEAENGRMQESLRVWESSVYFAVLGYSSHWKTELKSNHSIPFIRRKSGGQTVLQGPGCLNFSLVLKNDPATGIRTDTQNAMLKNMAAVQACLPGEPISIQGVSDLNWNDKKFSGNAMRRGKNYHLFHGTFLYDFDIRQIEKQLGKPDREPDYRKSRSHIDFLTNIPLSKAVLIKAMRDAWSAQNTLSSLPTNEVPRLLKTFYGDTAWNQKF